LSSGHKALKGLFRYLLPISENLDH